MGLTELSDQKGSASLLNSSTESLGDGGTFPTSPPPPHKVAAPLSWKKELAYADKACLVEIGWRKYPLRRCPHVDKVNGISLELYKEC